MNKIEDDKHKYQLDLSVFNTLKSIFGNAFRDAVDNHSKSAKENIKRIEKALETNDVNELEHAAHSLKGASAQFGAMSLSAVAKTLEKLGSEGKIEEAKELLDELITTQSEAEKLMLQEVG